MNIILITDDDPVDSWVASQIAQNFPVTQILTLQDSASQVHKSLGKKLLTAPLKSLSAVPRELLLRRLNAQRQEFMATRLWKGKGPGISPDLAPLVGVPIDQFNSPENAAHIQALSPDLIITCGGPILKATIFEIPRLGCLNVQFGISDAYRGQHTLFWPIATADWENVGATIHQIDRGVNTGDVLAQVHPVLTADDTEFSVEVKTAHAVLKALLELLSGLGNAPSQYLKGRVRQSQGQYILYRDRTPLREMKYRLRARFRTVPTLAQAEQQNYYRFDSPPVQMQ